MTRFVPTLASIVLAAAFALPAQAQNPNPYLQGMPAAAPMAFPSLGLPTLGIPGMPQGTQGQKFAPYEMSRMVTKAEKAQMMKLMMPWMSTSGSLNIRDVMNYMTTKYPAKPGLSFDDVVTSMGLRANQLNFKLVGHSPMYKDFEAVLGDTSAPRVEVFHYCDIAAGREVLKEFPESIVYLPCRIAVMEDKDKRIWVLTLDWDMSWLESINTEKVGVNPLLAKSALDIRDKMDNIMRAAANGEL
jgi:uncharacterized protein (DUF302 family)